MAKRLCCLLVVIVCCIWQSHAQIQQAQREALLGAFIAKFADIRNRDDAQAPVAIYADDAKWI
jgi:hypothetical protein